MACKLNVENVLSDLKSWKMTDDGRDAITKEFKFSGLIVVLFLLQVINENHVLDISAFVISCLKIWSITLNADFNIRISFIIFFFFS